MKFNPPPSFREAPHFYIFGALIVIVLAFQFVRLELNREVREIPDAPSEHVRIK